MASDAQINANRRNALLSTGPSSPAGRAKSAQNSRRHGMRAEQEKLSREEGIAYEERYFRWAANYGVETDPEEFLLQSNLFLASEMDRVRFAYLELTQGQIDAADDDEIKEAREAGNLLFSDPRGVPVAMYGSRRFNNKKPGGPSWGSEKAPALDPEEVMEKLESSAVGCYWIVKVLEELLERARKSFWVGGDRLQMIRLLGRNPVEIIADRRVAEVFAASHALRPVGRAFAELESDMSELEAENKEKEIRARWRDLSRKDEPEKARQSLIDLVQGEIERVEAIAAEHEENAGEDAARIRAPQELRIYPQGRGDAAVVRCAKGSVERGIMVIRKETKARKADRDGQGLPPVPGKDISPYDGRPAAWWRESAGEGRRAEGGGRRREIRAEGGGRRAEDENRRRAGSGGRRSTCG